jgi:hypothetical protein
VPVRPTRPATGRHAMTDTVRRWPGARSIGSPAAGGFELDSVRADMAPGAGCRVPGAGWQARPSPRPLPVLAGSHSFLQTTHAAWTGPAPDRAPGQHQPNQVSRPGLQVGSADPGQQVGGQRRLGYSGWRPRLGATGLAARSARGASCPPSPRPWARPAPNGTHQASHHPRTGYGPAPG